MTSTFLFNTFITNHNLNCKILYTFSIHNKCSCRPSLRVYIRPPGMKSHKIFQLMINRLQKSFATVRNYLIYCHIYDCTVVLVLIIIVKRSNICSIYKQRMFMIYDVGRS